ncbi:unnamed protein product, partial [Pleuronectes platessa]
PGAETRLLLLLLLLLPVCLPASDLCAQERPWRLVSRVNELWSPELEKVKYLKQKLTETPKSR